MRWEYHFPRGIPRCRRVSEYVKIKVLSSMTGELYSVTKELEEVFKMIRSMYRFWILTGRSIEISVKILPKGDDNERCNSAKNK